jgi:hypothetical protein
MFLGRRVRPVRRDDTFTAISEPIVYTMWDSYNTNKHGILTKNKKIPETGSMCGICQLSFCSVERDESSDRPQAGWHVIGSQQGQKIYIWRHWDMSR